MSQKEHSVKDDSSISDCNSVKMENDQYVPTELIQLLTNIFDQRYLKREVSEGKYLKRKNDVAYSSEIEGDTKRVMLPKKRVITNYDLEKPENRHLLLVRYEEKDEVKALGAQWDTKRRMWKIPDNYRDDELRLQAFEKFRTFEKRRLSNGEVLCYREV